MSELVKKWLVRELTGKHSAVTIVASDDHHAQSKVKYTIDEFLNLMSNSVPLKDSINYEQLLLTVKSMNSNGVGYEYNSPRELKHGIEQLKAFIKGYHQN